MIWDSSNFKRHLENDFEYLILDFSVFQVVKISIGKL